MSTASPSSSGRPLSRLLIWTPLLMVAALLYWTIALGLGGQSLLALTMVSGQSGKDDVGPTIGPRPADDQDALVPATDDAESIIVHLQESVEPEDVNDNAGSGTPTASDDPAVVNVPGPGQTAW
jgi:hypothetical protein